MKTQLLAIALPLFFTSASKAGELSDAFVSKLLGVQGVTHAPSKMLKHDLDYKDQAGQRMFTLRITEPSTYDMWKSISKKPVPVSGLGIDAFAEPTLNRVCAKTSTTAACANALLPRSDVKLTHEQLVEIVRAAL